MEYKKLKRILKAYAIECKEQLSTKFVILDFSIKLIFWENYNIIAIYKNDKCLIFKELHSSFGNTNYRFSNEREEDTELFLKMIKKHSETSEVKTFLKKNLINKIELLIKTYGL